MFTNHIVEPSRHGTEIIRLNLVDLVAMGLARRLIVVSHRPDRLVGPIHPPCYQIV